ncbi:MAG: hypothetical protein AB1512_22890 [Thermodesulfobacteriota bacterium]
MSKKAEALLPCRHDGAIVAQVEPTQRLLEHLDAEAPDLLHRHGVVPQDYRGSEVFRTAIESIRGHYAASMTTPRQEFVRRILELLAGKRLISEWQPAHKIERWDFEVEISSSPKRTSTIEVKGGEGNSLNISERSPYTQEFVVWCHLDGAIKNEPSRSVHSIISRLVADTLKRKKHIDALIVRDRLCGSRLRPCPKYGSSADYPQEGPAPDVFLFPAQVPDVLKNPKPSIHNEASCGLPFRILDAFGVRKRDRAKHLWEVHISYEAETGRGEHQVRRRVRIVHKGVALHDSIHSV